MVRQVRRAAPQAASRLGVRIGWVVFPCPSLHYSTHLARTILAGPSASAFSCDDTYADRARRHCRLPFSRHGHESAFDASLHCRRHCSLAYHRYYCSKSVIPREATRLKKKDEDLLRSSHPRTLLLKLTAHAHARRDVTASELMAPRRRDASRACPRSRSIGQEGPDRTEGAAGAGPLAWTARGSGTWPSREPVRHRCPVPTSSRAHVTR